jgi:hypothetical protein
MWLAMKLHSVKSFSSKEDAFRYMSEQVDEDPYVDNERFAFLDDREAMRAYKKAQRSGCCGFFDEVISVGGRLATIGCNYGH